MADFDPPPRYAYVDETAVRLNRTEAWALIGGKWEKFHPAEAVNAKVISEETFRRMFPQLPPLPKTAFQDAGS